MAWRALLIGPPQFIRSIEPLGVLSSRGIVSEGPVMKETPVTEVDAPVEANKNHKGCPCRTTGGGCMKQTSSHAALVGAQSSKKPGE